MPGGRIDNDLVRDEIRDGVMVRWAPQLLFYDERYFDTQAADLAADGLTAVEMHQGKPEMQAAWDLFYELIHAGFQPRIVHDGDPVLRRACRRVRRRQNRARLEGVEDPDGQEDRRARRRRDGRLRRRALLRFRAAADGVGVRVALTRGR